MARGGEQLVFGRDQPDEEESRHQNERRPGLSSRRTGALRVPGRRAHRGCATDAGQKPRPPLGQGRGQARLAVADGCRRWPLFQIGLTGRAIDDGCSVSWKTSCTDGKRVTARSSDSPLPVFRA
jgi:hypothetical protein